MSWKPINLKDSEYRKRLESIQSKMIELRDKMVETEVAKLEHLADVMRRVNEHKEKQNVVDT